MTPDEKLDSLLELVDDYALKYLVKTLREAHQALLDTSGLKVGDRVVLKRPPAVETLEGWAPYRECLVKGSTGLATTIAWNTHTRRVSVGFQPEVCWSVSTWGGSIRRLRKDPAGIFYMSADRFSLAKAKHTPLVMPESAR